LCAACGGCTRPCGERVFDRGRRRPLRKPLSRASGRRAVTGRPAGMCGIAGLAWGEPHAHPPGASAAVVRAMADMLTHRGPDDSGVWESADGNVALGHRRLAIIDLSPLGRNPMAWDGGRLWITFNGEIYNFLDLRTELEAFG